MRTLQLESNIAAIEIMLSADQMSCFGDASQPAPTFSGALVTPKTGRLISGGRDVIG